VQNEVTDTQKRIADLFILLYECVLIKRRFGSAASLYECVLIKRRFGSAASLYECVLIKRRFGSAASLVFKVR